jgi:FMN phosphatase YigB (HAD superfamily)
VGVAASATIFVGDTWEPDVVGPRAVGMTPLYLSRDGHWGDETAPADLGDVQVAPDLRALLTMFPGP